MVKVASQDGQLPSTQNEEDMITDNQRIILGAMSTLGSGSTKELARQCGLKEHSFRYGLQKCFDQELVLETRQVNFGRLGLQTYNLYFSLPYQLNQEHLDCLTSDNRVVWVAENVTDGRYEVTVVAKTPRELANWSQQLAQRSGIVLANPIWTVELEFHYFGDRFLAPQFAPNVISVDLTVDATPVDKLDLQVLDLLCYSPSASTPYVARLLGLPATTVEYRTKRLVSSGIVTPTLYSTNLSTINAVECQLLVTFHKMADAVHDRMFQFCLRNPSVSKLVKAFGTWHYKVLAKATTIEELGVLRRALEHEFHDCLAGVIMLNRRRLLMRAPSLANHPQLRS